MAAPLTVDGTEARPAFPTKGITGLKRVHVLWHTILFWEPKWTKIILDVSKDGTARLFITILFTLEKNRKQPKCPTVGDWLEEWSSSI